jgi:hypothetical protein
MNHHRLGIVPHPGRRILQRHRFQYRTPLGLERCASTRF